MTTELEQRLKERYGLEEVHDVTSIRPAVETMEALGDPQDAFFSVHVAGTNGKGSTCSLVASMLQEAGYSVGLYTGPALTDFRDQFRVDGEPIAEDRLFELAEEIDAAADPSMYEFSTALAFLHFAREGVDVAVVETGVGGRLDATNVMDSDLCIITSIGMDHSDVLGDDRRTIAGEKAAIVDGSTRAVVSMVDDDVADVIEDAAAEAGAPVRRPRREVRLERDGEDGLTAVSRQGTVDTGMLGTYQQQNINAAIAAVHASPFEVDWDDILSAIEDFSLEARMEPVASDPLTVLDGAHNPLGVRALTVTLDELGVEPVVVFSVMADKDWEEMLDALADHAGRFVFARASEDRAEDPAALDAYVGLPSEVVEDPVEAVERGRELAREDGAVLVTGSLYFCGDVRSHLLVDR